MKPNYLKLFFALVVWPIVYGLLWNRGHQAIAIGGIVLILQSMVVSQNIRQFVK